MKNKHSFLLWKEVSVRRNICQNLRRFMGIFFGSLVYTNLVYPVHKISVLKKFRKFHRKIPALESLFNIVAGLKVCNFIKK